MCCAILANHAHYNKKHGTPDWERLPEVSRLAGAPNECGGGHGQQAVGMRGSRCPRGPQCIGPAHILLYSVELISKNGHNRITMAMLCC
mmetsp:Transcript_13957/g.23228  ORF Transcript_13957/g.23228 Transcript_13957/m.23228 type:complete len:89 (+) Transcript_13957:2348-2614(+)